MQNNNNGTVCELRPDYFSGWFVSLATMKPHLHQWKVYFAGNKVTEFFFQKHFCKFCNLLHGNGYIELSIFLQNRSNKSGKYLCNVPITLLGIRGKLPFYQNCVP
jgi:hypothetical protein